MFWAFAALLTALAVAAVIVPLLRRTPAAGARALYDRAVYRDQLAELERDVERGVLTPEQAAAARIEIERRLLATAGAEEEKAPETRVDPVTTVFIAGTVSAGAMALYLALGAPAVKDEPFAARATGGSNATADPAHDTGGTAPGDLARSAEALERKLKENPGDGDGWALLARTQAVLGRYGDAAGSYQRALTLVGDRPDVLAGYGEMLVLSGDGIVTPEARTRFQQAVKGDPQNVAARFYLGLADAQAGKAKEAIAAWQAIEADAPPDAPWLVNVRERIEATAKSAGIPVPPPQAGKAVAAAPAAPPAPRGPSAADMEAASKMAPEDRQQMIRSMVEGLAQRLEQNPNDPAGWERLANAYRVLGETEKAEKAAARAKEVQGGSAAAGSPAAAPKGPSAADVDAAKQMTTEDRQKMIRGMVDSLAQRMQQNPADAVGWTRLGRAYRVLGERAKAEDALAKAAELQPKSADAQLDLALAVLENDGGDKPGTMLSDRFVQQVRKVALLQPENPEVLWYLGLAAAQRKRPDDAKSYWSKLLAQLQPGTGDYDTVNQAIQALR